jgi:hypothetical protein
MGPHITDVDSVSYGSLIGLNTENAAPPTNAYIAVDDVLQVTVYSSGAVPYVKIYARILLADGRIVPNDWTCFGTNGRNGFSTYQQLSEGFLLAITAYDSDAFLTGQTYVRVALLRGGKVSATSAQILLAGYITKQNLLSWPASPLTPSTDGKGYIRTVIGSQPSAGGNVFEQVPTFVLWRLIAFEVKLTTSAAVAARAMVLTFSDGSFNVFAQVATPNTQAASLAVSYSYFDGGAAAASGAVVNNPLPSQMFLEPGYVIRTTVALLDVADQLTAPIYLVEEWLQI